MKQYRFIIRTFLVFLLLSAGLVNQTWATDVTYHILTLPIPNPSVPGNYNYHMTSAVTGKRLEAVKVVVKGQTQLELPAHFKSPLADNFTYYAVSDPNITKSGSAIKLFDASNNSHKAFTYEVNGGATPVAEKTPLSGSTAEYYVVYTYNASNTIAQLNGSVKYNLSVKNKGFFSLNRGRNNRPAAMPKDKVNAEMLASEEFVYINNPGSGIATYWDGKADQKNKKEDIESQFHFIFQFEGVDPYNIIIRTAYDKNTTYIEKNDNSNPAEFVYKYYKEGSFFTNGTAKGYFASDEHRHYNYTYDSSLDANPTDLRECSEDEHNGWDAQTGYYHGQKGPMWNSFALLYNSDRSGYVFMGTRTVDGSGKVPDPKETKDGLQYYYLKTDNNDFFINQLTTASVSSNYTIEGIYPIKTITFKVKTKFYNEGGTADEKAAHTVSATANISQYTIDNDKIDDKFIPDELRRKYCTFTTTYRNSDGEVITKYSQMKSDGVIFLEYNVSEESLPFKAITPAASYNADTWKSATWYELTDDRSTQADGKKLQVYQDGVNYKFKNNGDADDYAKTSEYAFIGDPYELLVVYRDATQAPANTTHVPYYVGVGTLNTGEDLTTSTTASDGYKWEMPDDATAGSFLLRNYKDANKGYWRWDTDHINETRTYATKSGQTISVTNSEAQTITLNITDFAGGDGHYFKITAAGTNPGQIDSSDPVLGTGMGAINGTSGTATITLKSSGDAAKSFKLSIQEYNLDNVAQGDPCDITINQGTTPYAGNNVEYSTEGATRIKLMPLPKFAYTYQVIDMSGAIAIKATVSQPIFTPLSGYDSIPEIIRSPFLADETVTYYSEYSGEGRGNLDSDDIIDEVPNAAADIFISYTLTNLPTKNIKLDASQRFKVKLDEEYIYYDATKKKILSTLEPSTESSVSDYYSWKLLGQDPYAMLIENEGNHQYVKVHEGTWGDDDDRVLDFDTEANASHFIAMMGNFIGVYEVMAATGNTSYYHIGRPSTSGAETMLYSTTTYDHGAEELRFELAGEDAITYHLIDKSNTDLLQVSTYNPRLALPAEYVSPLVSTYYYYKTEAGAIANNAGDRITEITQDLDKHIYVTYDVNDLIGFNNSGRIDDHPYLLRFLQPFEEGYYLEDGNDKLTITKLKAIYPYCNGDGNLNVYGERMRNEQMDGGSSTRSRWVWFFESAHNDPYHVRLHSRNTIEYESVKYPTYLQTSVVQFKQDPGNNRIVTGGALPGIASETPTEYMVLGTAGQFRLRTTYKINDGTSDVRRDVKTLEQYWKTYNMIKHEMLKITSGDAFSTDPTTWVVPTDKRAELKEKLQRLKYTAADEANMIAQIEAFTSTGVYYFRIGTSEPYSYKKITVTKGATTEPASVAEYTSEGCSQATWEGPNYVDGWIWHSYEEYANATRWNGYNDKESGEGKKVVEKLEHWYQTFDMGDGSFNVETAVIPPVLILLDRHGWEIMRKPLPDKSTYPYGTEILAALKAYDSPLVKEYKFYSNATKGTGCHKYTLRMQDGKERDQIKVDGKHFTSKSLAVLPPLEASGVLSSGVLNDQFVTYTVKEEYEDNYEYDLTLNKEEGTFTETGTSLPYLVLQNSRFYKTPNSDNQSYISKPIYEHTSSGKGNVYDLIADPVNHGGTNADIIDKDGNWIQNNFWRVIPNLDIDEEMGIVWTSETDTTKLEPYTRYLTKEKYENRTGFDPYNIQLQLINQNNGTPDGRFLTTHMTSTSIVNGAMVGDYSDGGTVKITLETRRDATNPADVNLVHSEGYDHSDIKMTNQTFMAVSDANGNMQLMPRFDHSLRVDLANSNPWETTLKAPKDNGKKASADDNNSMGSQTTFFVPARRYHYHIIDNEGNEAIRYKRGGDFYPAITDHFRSPIANEFKYYKTAYTESISSDAAYTAAVTSDYFKKTVANESEMTTAANALTVVDDYYFKIGESTYKKVTVTKAHSGSTNATYTIVNCTEADWTNAEVKSRPEVADLAVFQTGVDALTTTGTYYYKIGPFNETYNYKKIVVKSGKSNFPDDVSKGKDISGKEITGSLAEAGLTDVDNHVYVRYSYDEGADIDADQILQGKWFTVKLANKDVRCGDSDEINTSNGTGVSLYAGAESRSSTARDDTEYATKRGSLPQIGDYYFRVGTSAPYKYNKVDVTAVSPLAYTETLNGDYATEWSNSKPLSPNSDDYARKWQWKFLVAPIDPSSELHESPDPYAVKLFNRKANYSTDLSPSSPMSVPIKVPNDASGANRFVLLSHPDGGYALAVARTDATYIYKFLNGAAMTTPTTTAATTYIENRQQITVTDEDYETEKSKLPSAIDEEYFFKINNVAYMQVTVTGGPDAPVRTEGVPENPKSYKDEWTSATGNLKKTAADVSDYNKQRDALKDNGVYYFRITSNSVTYKKVAVISGVKNETVSNEAEWNTGTYRFTYNTNALSPGTQLLVNNDVTHEYTYHVITNKKMVEEVNVGNKLAVSGTQTNEEAASHSFAPHLPEGIQTPLLNDKEDYLYYGSATESSGTYTVVPQTKLFTLHGLYDDVVYVRYGAYSMDKTPFKVPNVRNATSETIVAKGEGSQDASLNIEGGLPYNIIWYDDNMMSTNEEDTQISPTADHALDGNHKYIWYFTDNDPYALKIKHKLTGNYVNGTTTLTNEAGAKQFMLLKKDGYDYGILQVTGTTGSDAGKKLTGYGGALTSINPEDENYEPKKFIIFGLSVHDLIYRLIIARTCTDSEKASPAANQYVDIPCKGETGNTKRIFGTSQRDLSTTYQLGGTINVDTTPYDYCVDAGAVSIGDLLQVPNEFRRPNCSYEFYIDGVWNDYNSSTKTISGANDDLNEMYKGVKLNEESPRLMSDEKLINKVVRVNIVYSFDKEVATNNGMDFVKSTNDKCWYTFETPSGTTPYLAHYTNAWGLQSMEGRATRYTNDYLWTPVGDVYGFKLYNRYMIKNSNASKDDDTDKMMTFAGTAGDNIKLVVAKPGTGSYTSGNEVFELLPGDNPNSGYFRVHPVVNNSGTQYYVRRKDTSGDIDDDEKDDLNYTILSTTPSDWRFGLSMDLMEPYYERAGYVGGLKPEGKTAYETAVSSGTIMDIQHVVYDDEKIIPFISGYYRLHNQPGVSSISPVRYASGYLHETEKTAVSGGIPMHFYSKAGVKTTFEGESGLESGFTLTNATRGEIPVPATEEDPSTIFYLNGTVTSNKTISTATMSTQGLNVSGNKMTTGEGTTFTLIDIGGATFLVVDKLDPETRNYLNFDQTYEESSVKMIYDLKFAHNVPTDDAKWCLQPVQKTGTAGNGEMPLKITTNDGGDEYYYSTFYAPFDVLLPADAGGKTYNAYVCKKWYDTGVHPVKVPAVTTPSYSEGKFVPAGTPVIIRTNDDSEVMTLTLPGNPPSSSLDDNIFLGTYLEQLLTVDASHDVYTLGLPMKSDVKKDNDYDTSGDIVAPKPEFADNGVGFYINATPNKEANAMKANWTRNNRYVLHNKIYYRAEATSGAPAPAKNRAPEFVPVIFGDEEQQEMNPDGTMEVVGDGCIYDLMGRKVATREQVEDGSWKQRVATGIYILNGKKFQKK